MHTDHTTARTRQPLAHSGHLAGAPDGQWWVASGAAAELGQFPPDTPASGAPAELGEFPSFTPGGGAFREQTQLGGSGTKLGAQFTLAIGRREEANGSSSRLTLVQLRLARVSGVYE